MTSEIKMRTFLLAGLLALAPMAHAAEWYLLDLDKNGVARFYDQSSIRNVSGTRLGWTQVVYADKAVKNGVKSLKLRYAAHCGSNTIQLMSGVTYNTNTEVIYSFQQPRDASEIIPDSVGEAVFNLLCFGKGAKEGKSFADPVAAIDAYFNDTN